MRVRFGDFKSGETRGIIKFWGYKLHTCIRGVRQSLLDCGKLSSAELATRGLQKINSDAHADARVRTGRAAGPNRVRIFALWTGHRETAVPFGFRPAYGVRREDPTGVG